MTAPLVVVVDRFPERTQTFVTNELRELRARGVRPHVFHLREPLDAATEVADLTATRLPDATHAGRAVLLGRLLRLVPSWGAGPLRILRMLVEHRDPDIVEACLHALDLVDRLDGPPAWIHAHFANAPAGVAMFAAAITGARWSFTGHANDLFVRAVDLQRKLDRADLVVDVCDYNRRWLDEHHPHGSAHVLVPCGVDATALVRRRPHPPAPPLRVLGVGRLVPKKGFDDLVTAMGVLRGDGVDVVLDLVGDGHEGDRLRRLVVDLGLEDRVTFHGSVPATRVREHLERAHVLCLPSVVAADGDRDSQPVVVKEAMAMEVAVVATDEVGLPDMVVDGETGCLVPPHAPDRLAAALAGLAADPDATVRMGRAGRARVQQAFAFDVTIPRLLEAWGLDG